MQFERFNTKVTIYLPKNSCGYFTTKFKTDKIEQVCGNEQRIWIGILNRSLTEDVLIRENDLFGFFVLETNGHIDIKHETDTKKKRASSKTLRKNIKRWFLKQI